MNHLKRNLTIGFVFISILGTLFHFVYSWSENNWIIGLFTPITESTFDHMKLIFFPGLLYLPIATYFLKNTYPQIQNALSYGILIGTLFIPIFFYTYSGILGTNYSVINIASFYLAAFLVFFSTACLLKHGSRISPFGFYLLYAFTLFFIYFTYRNSGIGIFSVG